MWQMLHSISGKRKDKTTKYLVTDSDTITNKAEIAETLARSFAAKSSPDDYHEKFRRIRDRESKTHWTLSQIMTKGTMLFYSQRELY